MTYPTPQTSATARARCTTPSRAPCAAACASKASPPVVYSTEVPSDVKLLPLPEEEFQKDPEGVSHLRVCIPPVFGLLPALFWLHITTYVLCTLASKPIALRIKNRPKVYECLLRDLLNRERERADDIALLFEYSHHGRSVLPPHLVPAFPTLVHWDPDAAPSLENIAVMDAGDDGQHLTDGPWMWREEVRAVVKRSRGRLQGCGPICLRKPFRHCSLNFSRVPEYKGACGADANKFLPSPPHDFRLNLPGLDRLRSQFRNDGIHWLMQRPTNGFIAQALKRSSLLMAHTNFNNNNNNNNNNAKTRTPILSEEYGWGPVDACKIWVL
ncbi:hypothetical protein DFH07DRAFT_784472 [Mycena maculata]|uniref:Uncharacterized protein n=1 Tax=Mycena maculata TaxID=230809 RepID=A0AAD7MJ91_9AGAR|nr:hypothetical protein DFH07DRAFT_784472 [Mycena maculata]